MAGFSQPVEVGTCDEWFEGAKDSLVVVVEPL